MTPNKLNTEATPQSHTLEALKQLIPACFTEVKNEQGELQQVVDWDTLKQLLGENIADENNERYQFTWAGKQAARLEANKATSQTLRPVPEDSVDWDTTENLYIEGDNLQVLKLLQQGYMGKVKMIYIDPPYNTGNDFVYDDDFARSQAEEDLDSGDIDEDGNRYRKNNRTNGRFHSDWCSMIYPRLLIARSLLTEDGVIFISIDDNEVHNLRKICDEVFGEGNFVCNFIWVTKNAARGVPPKNMIMENHENILCYSRNKDFFTFKGIERDESDFSNPDNDKRGLWRSESIKATGKQNNYFSIINPENGDEFYDNWAFSKDTLESMIRDNLILFPNNQEGIPRQKKFINSYINDKKAFVTNLGWFSTENSTKFLMRIFNNSKIFDFPKPIELVNFLLKQSTELDSLILDFFSGSATTAHAVMQLNAEDGGKRKYICVQLEESTPEDSEARKAGYTSIPEIAKERIRRAGQKIKAEAPLTTQNLDIGFRVLRLADSNFNEVNRHPNEYDQVQLDLFATNIKEDRKDLDLLFGAMLSWGVPLSLPINTDEIDGCRIYNVNDGDLIACFAENVNEAVVKAMASKVSLRVLFRDSCFSEDKHKINILEIFKQQLGWDEKEAMDKIRVI